ncbi:hypothetical protein V5O48_009458 [Marasmius crinis-equi]|uniref:Uncharacterized protein n=1 Tax=Marasmius crinis-equi TaxID=585013 RepID=A0ABR3FB16_9AGAR
MLHNYDPKTHRVCYCQRQCQATPEGKVIPFSTWKKHQAAIKRGGDQPEEGEERKRRKRGTRKATSDILSSQASGSHTTEPDKSQPVQHEANHQRSSNSEHPEEEAGPLSPPLFDDIIHNEDTPMQEPPLAPAADKDDLNHITDEFALFNVDEEDRMPISLDDLKENEETLEGVRLYNYEAEKQQWTEDEFESFQNPTEEEWCSDNHDITFSLQCYLSMAGRCLEDVYKMFRQLVLKRFPDCKMLSYEQVQTRLRILMGVLPLHFDMYCAEPRYTTPDSLVPRRQFTTVPLGPQLQARWKSPDSVVKLRDRLIKTEPLLRQYAAGGVQSFNDIYCGTEYLDLVSSGKLGKNDMLIAVSMDGAQLYRDKESDTWFGIATILDLPGKIRHKKENVLPLFTIGGPNPPKDYDSFLFPIFAHLSACQKNGIRMWNAQERTSFVSHPWLGFGLADMVGMAELSGSVGHHGRNGCRLMCPMPRRHKPGVGTYYPAMLQPNGDNLPKASRHDDIDINAIRMRTPAEYKEQLCYVLSSKTTHEFEDRCKETGLRKRSIVSALPKAIPAPKSLPADVMHLFYNISQLLSSSWRGAMDHATEDQPANWVFAVLLDKEEWAEHGQQVADARRYIPVCLEDRTPRNPAEKINSGYKIVEYLTYIFGFCPALLYGLLPSPFYEHFCKLVFAARILNKRQIEQHELAGAHKAFLEWVTEYELLYVNREMKRLHLIRPCVHALVHLVVELLRLGSLLELSQHTMECTIGNLVKELRLHSNPYENLSQRITERARINALHAIAPGLFLDDPDSKLLRNSIDVGDQYVLLCPREDHNMDPEVLDAFREFARHQKWRIEMSKFGLTVSRFSRLLLPNGQIARSWWHERKHPDEEVRRARNIKFLLNGGHRFAEVLYFFLVKNGDIRYTLAAVKTFLLPNPDLLDKSYNTLWNYFQMMQHQAIMNFNIQAITEEQLRLSGNMVYFGLQQGIQGLRKRIDDLQTELIKQNTMVTATATPTGFPSAGSALSMASTGPRIVLQKSEYPNVKHWDRIENDKSQLAIIKVTSIDNTDMQGSTMDNEDDNESSDSESKSDSTSDMCANPESGKRKRKKSAANGKKSQSKKGRNAGVPAYLEDENGKTVTISMKKRVYSDAKGYWNDTIQDITKAPPNWTNAGAKLRDGFRDILEDKHPFLRLCSDQWKVEEVWKRQYHSWLNNRLKRQSKKAKLSESSENPESSPPGEAAVDAPLLEAAPANSDKGKAKAVDAPSMPENARLSSKNQLDPLLAGIQIDVQALSDKLSANQTSTTSLISTSVSASSKSTSTSTSSKTKTKNQTATPAKTQPVVFTCFKTLREAVEGLPQAVPTAKKNGPLGKYSGKPAAQTAGCTDDALVWESGWDTELTVLIPADIEKVCGLVVQGKYGLIGLVQVMEHLVRDRKVPECLLEMKVQHLLSAIDQVKGALVMNTKTPSSNSAAAAPPPATPNDSGSMAPAPNTSTARPKGTRGARGTWAIPKLVCAKWECAAEWKMEEKNKGRSRNEFESDWDAIISKDEGRFKIYKTRADKKLAQMRPPKK